MPRPLLSAALASVVALIITSLAVGTATVRAAEPEQKELIDASTAAGLTCEEYSPSMFTCELVSDERSWSSVIGGFGDDLYVSVGRYLYGVPHRPVESDIFGLMKEYVRLLLDDEAEALAWLDRMNDGPQESGELLAEQRRLTWWTYSGEPSQINLAIDWFPTAAPSSASPEPVDLADSSEGEWLYEGTWTIESIVTDADSPLEDVGRSSPGTLAIDCSVGVGACFLSGEGFPVPPDLVEILDAGRLRFQRSTEDQTCPGGRTTTETVEVEHGPDEAIATVREASDPLTCDTGDGGQSMAFDYSWVFRGDLVSFVAPEAPLIPGASEPPPAVPVDPAARPESPARQQFADSVPAPAEVSTDPIVLLQSAALAALLVFLMPFPSQLFNSTLETHEDEVKRWLRLDRIGSAVGKLGAFWGSWPGVAIFTLLAALLYGFLDPGFGISLASLATFLGMLVGIVLVTAAFAVPVVLAHRRLGDSWQLKVVPVSLLIGVACVLLSRLTGFQPGYLYGLLIGLAFARELSAADEGRATAIGAAVMLVVAFAAWLGLGALPEGDAFGLVVLRTSLAALMVAGLEGVVFGLLPMRFLPGEPLYAWNRILWGGLLAVGAFAFFHILINPASGYLSDSSRTPLFTVVGLLLGFSLVSVAFWAWFRVRNQPRPGAKAEA